MRKNMKSIIALLLVFMSFETLVAGFKKDTGDSVNTRQESINN